MGVPDALLDLIESLLEYRFQRVVLIGQASECLPVKTGVPQVSILGPVFFSNLFNNQSIDMVAFIKLFADDRYITILHYSWC